MSVQSQFTPEEIQALVSGQVVSKSSKTSPKVELADEPKVDPSAPEAPSSFTPKNSIPINGYSKVERPHIKDGAGKRISPDEVVTVSAGVFDKIDRGLAEARLKAEEEKAARAELERKANPAQLLNQMNGMRRIIEKLQKEVADLKKKTND